MTLIHLRAPTPPQPFPTTPPPTTFSPASLYCPVVSVTLTAPYCKAPGGLMISPCRGNARLRADARAAAADIVFQLNYRPYTLFPVVAQRGCRSIMGGGGAVKQLQPRRRLLVWTFCPCAGSRRRLRAPVHHIYTATKRPILPARTGEKRMPPICCALINMPPCGTIQE